MDKNSIVNAISDDQAVEIFQKYGWTIIGYDAQYTRCPICR